MARGHDRPLVDWCFARVKHNFALVLTTQVALFVQARRIEALNSLQAIQPPMTKELCLGCEQLFKVEGNLSKCTQFSFLVSFFVGVRHLFALSAGQGPR